MDVRIEPGDYYSDGKWKVIEAIGHGSYGVIYQVEQNSTEEDFAMKVSRKTEAAVEISALKQFKGNTYFPTVYDEFPIGSVNHHTAFVIDLGVHDLFRLRANNFNKIFEEETTLCLAYHIFSALEFLHKKFLVHRDMKETNVVLKRDPRAMPIPIMVIDLGLSISIEAPRKPDGRDNFFSKSDYCTPWMNSGQVATRRCDLVMTLYFLILERGARDPFTATVTMSSLAKRTDFESNPELYIKNGEAWLVDLAHCILDEPPSSPPNYNGIHEILGNAKSGFMPHRKFLHITNNDGKDCLC